ncbi:MAG: protein-disulfide reductase DsbD family protein [Paracoccaceae bacterium]|nr:protein-disulfide reductase DsbD family protein [Paracoccaceae bacterium]MDE2916064.1 protein-disulfide reductase DsbD family protein [Paracoccaceae bacterium]MYE36891.1 hypothetical protein [Paracoccaceae bacterium]
MKKQKRLLLKISFIRFFYILLLIGYFNPSLSSESENSDLVAYTASIPEEIYTLEILHGWREEKNGIEIHNVGIDIKLVEGWKTYWRKTGNTGIPLSIEWLNKNNFQDYEIHWPNPSIVDMAGEQSIGYTDRVVFPLQIKPEQPGIPISGVGTIFMGVCKDVCIPVFEEISIDLLPSGEMHWPALHNSLMSKPTVLASTNHQDEIDCKINYKTNPPVISTSISTSLLNPDKPFLAIYESTADPVFFYKPREILENREFSVIYTDFEFLEDTSQKLDNSKILLTILTDNQTYEIQGCQ